MQKAKARSLKNLKNKSVVHVVTGSIAAIDAGRIAQALRQEGAHVTCVMTASAKEFVPPLVLRAFSGEKVYHSFFSADTPYDVLHTSLAEKASLILVAPASADFIARLAGGFADDLASCVILAAACPILIAPAMNDRMYAHPLTQQNIRKLKDIGYRFIDPVGGHLVCGKEAIGHIPEPEAIVRAVEKAI